MSNIEAAKQLYNTCKNMDIDETMQLVLSADNAEERKRRKAFYLRNGLKETGVFVNVYGTDFELITPDGSLSYETYVRILEDVLGKEGTEILNPVLISAEG